MIEHECKRSIEDNQSNAIQTSSVDIGDYHFHPEFVGQDSPFTNLSLIERTSGLSGPALSKSESFQSTLKGEFVPTFNHDSFPRQAFVRNVWRSADKRKRGRIFHMAKSGFTKWNRLGVPARFLTLSTPVGYDISRLSRDKEVLRKRIEHVTFERDGFNGFRMEFLGVTTSEGNGVIHMPYVALPLKCKYRQASLFTHVRKRKGGVAFNPKFDIGYIPFDWLKRNWAEINGNSKPETQNVYINKVRGANKLVGYLLQYVSGQDKLLRMSYTKNWLYSGAVRDWNTHFKPRLIETYCYRDSLLDAEFNAEMRAIYRDWDKWIFDKAG